MSKPIYREGQRVRLKACPAEGWDEEFGTCLGLDGGDENMDACPEQIMYVVELDVKYAVDDHDDLLREVSEDQMEPA